MARLFNDGLTQSLRVDTAAVAAVPLTMAAWFYSDDTTVEQGLVWVGDKDTADDFHSLEIRGSAAGDPVCAFSRDGNTRANSTAAYTANTWHHGCAVFAANNDRSAFIDGANKGTDNTISNDVNFDRTAIGANEDSSPSDYMSGRIAEAAIWDVALTDAEVLILAHGVRPVFVRPGNLVFYLPLIRDDDRDLVGGLALNAINNPTVAAHCSMYYTASAFVGLAKGIVVPVLAMHHFRKRRSKN